MGNGRFQVVGDLLGQFVEYLVGRVVLQPVQDEPIMSNLSIFPIP